MQKHHREKKDLWQTKTSVQYAVLIISHSSQPFSAATVHSVFNVCYAIVEFPPWKEGSLSLSNATNLLCFVALWPLRWTIVLQVPTVNSVWMVSLATLATARVVPVSNKKAPCLSDQCCKRLLLPPFSQCVIVMDTTMCVTIPTATVCVMTPESRATGAPSAKQRRVSAETLPIFATVSSFVVKGNVQ